MGASNNQQVLKCFLKYLVVLEHAWRHSGSTVHCECGGTREIIKNGAQIHPKTTKMAPRRVPKRPKWHPGGLREASLRKVGSRSGKRTPRLPRNDTFVMILGSILGPLFSKSAPESQKGHQVRIGGHLWAPRGGPGGSKSHFGRGSKAIPKWIRKSSPK